MDRQRTTIPEDIKIGMIGLGLIGGSIAQAIKARSGITVYAAVDNDRTSLLKAHEDECIQNYDNEITAVKDCDIVFVCVPVSRIVPVLEKLRDFYTGIVTDTASTKGSIAKYVAAHCKGMRYIGGHPMAGSDKTGYGASSAGLFENAPYMICTNEQIPASRKDLAVLEDIVRMTGARPLYMDAAEHDKAVGMVSHLPHVAAYALVEAISSVNDDRLKTIAAGGFKDITRIASSDPALWADILCDSGDTVLDLLDDYSDSIEKIKVLIKSGKKEELKTFLGKMKDFRDSMVLPGVSPKENVQLWVDIDDRPGMIASVAGIFAESGINIRNISIQDSREYEGGSLRITVLSAEDASRGADLLDALRLKARVVR